MTFPDKETFLDSPLPAITKVLNATKPEADHRALQRWRRKVGDTEADRILHQSRERGIQMDDIMDHLLETGECDHPMVAQNLLDYEMESTHTGLHNNIWKGERDAKLIDACGYSVCVDWKTSAKPKKREWWRDELLQLAALNALDPCDYGMIMCFVWGETTIIKVQAFTWGADELTAALERFQRRLKEYSE